MLKRKYSVIVTITLLICITIFIINPSSCMRASLTGIRIWLINVVPALFPFFILTRLIIAFNQTSIPMLDKFTSKCFRTNNAGLIYFLSILSGYPVGAKLISNSYEVGSIDKTTATKMFSFCSTSGPMFIVGTIGIGVFHSAKVGYILLIGHIIGSCLNGLLYRGKSTPQTFVTHTVSVTTINDIMYESIISILLVGGYIIFSSVCLELLTITNILPLVVTAISRITTFDYNTVYSSLCGVVEITNGLINLGESNISLFIKIIISSVLIGFSGICIMLQSTAFLNKVGIKKSTMITQKLTQALFSGLATAIIALILY